MRKILLALALGATLFASCTSGYERPQVKQFTYEMGGSTMYRTKAVESKDVLDAIEATLPSSIQFVLTSKATGKNFTGRTGEGIILPSDTYKAVAGLSGSPTSGEIISGRSAFLTSSPQVTISQDLVVTDDVTDYTLTGTYGSFAIVIDSTEVEKAVVTTTKGKEEIKFLTSGESRITFAQGDFSSVYLEITLTPVDKERYKETTFQLSTTKHNGVGFVENGFYYVLHPTATGAQPKIIGLDLPTFSEGTL